MKVKAENGRPEMIYARYKLTFPKGIVVSRAEGQEVTIEGEMAQAMVDFDQLRHLLEDAGLDTRESEMCYGALSETLDLVTLVRLLKGRCNRTG